MAKKDDMDHMRSILKHMASANPAQPRPLPRIISGDASARQATPLPRIMTPGASPIKPTPFKKGK